MRLIECTIKWPSYHGLASSACYPHGHNFLAKLPTWGAVIPAIKYVFLTGSDLTTLLTYSRLVLVSLLITWSLLLIVVMLESVVASSDALRVVHLHLRFLHPDIEFVILSPPTPEEVRQTIYLQIEIACILKYSGTFQYTKERTNSLQKTGPKFFIHCIPFEIGP